jgi:hypothetical protein
VVGQPWALAEGAAQLRRRQWRPAAACSHEARDSGPFYKQVRDASFVVKSSPTIKPWVRWPGLGSRAR